MNWLVVLGVALVSGAIAIAWLPYLTARLQLTAARVTCNPFELWRWQRRGVPLSVLTRAAIVAAKGYGFASLDWIAEHYLKGGRPTAVAFSLEMAKRLKIPVTFREMAELDLTGVRPDAVMMVITAGEAENIDDGITVPKRRSGQEPPLPEDRIS